MSTEPNTDDQPTPRLANGLRRDDLITMIGLSTVGFIRHNGNEPPNSLGSGTLIKYGKVFGVVTCAHACEAVKASREVGVMCFTVRGKTQQAKPFDPDDMETVSFGQYPWTVRGPDLAFVRLPAEAEGHFQSLATVRNLQRQWELLTGEAFRDYRCHAVGGVVNAKTKVGSPSAGRGVVSFSAFVSVGRVKRRFAIADDYEKLIYAPQALPMTELPEHWKGTSGGGLWRVRVGEDDEGQRKLDVALAGIAHMETRPGGNIVCHGPRSLYGRLVAAMRAKWPNDCQG
jgi:hypothetical protein